MTFNKTLLLVLLSIFIGWIYFSFSPQQPLATQPPTKLATVGAQCTDIAERAVANIVPIVEFQRLERISRQSNVLARCMRDHGYSERPAWLSYATTAADAHAKQNNISAAAALEDMRRQAMSRFNITQNEPIYWGAKK
jgi:hypothetical protein